MKSSNRYRERCYGSFVSAHWAYNHDFSKKTYDLFSKVARKRFRKFLPADKKAKVVDIACGAGHFLYFVQHEGFGEAIGIDVSEEQLELARKAGVRNVHRADLFEYLQENPGSFDMVAANDIIEHLQKDETLRFLDATYRSLMKSGTCLISTVNAQSLFGATAVFRDFTHEQGFTPGSLAQVMRICNFEEVSVYGEKPVAHDIRSATRAGLWWCFENVLKAYAAVERGTGRGLWRHEDIFEPRIFAVGRKIDE